MPDVGSLSQPSARSCSRYTKSGWLLADGALPYYRALDRIYISALDGVPHALSSTPPTPARRYDHKRPGGGGTVPEPLVGWAIYLQGFYN